MKKVMIGIVAMMFVAGTVVFAGNNKAKKATCAKQKSECCKPGASCCKPGAACCIAK